MLADYTTRRYAILEHRWNGIHWDFLIEDGPTLRTWAIDSPIRSGVIQPVRSLPAHRRIYLDYEGPISGNRGEVRRWDQGAARVEVWDDRGVRCWVEGDQLVGIVSFWADNGGETDADGPRRWLFRFGKLS